MLKHFRSEQGAAHLLVVILLVVIIGGVGFFAYKAWSENASQKAGSNITAISTPSPTPDPYAGWKTYKFTKEGFTIRYPQSWTLREDEAQPGVFGSFTLTSPNRFVVWVRALGMQADGGYGEDQKFTFTDTLMNANYKESNFGQPITILGRYNMEENCCDQFYGRFWSTIKGRAPELSQERYDDGARNWVEIRGEYEVKDSQGNNIPQKHIDIDKNLDIVEARKILGSLKYD